MSAHFMKLARDWTWYIIFGRYKYASINEKESQELCGHTMWPRALCSAGTYKLTHIHTPQHHIWGERKRISRVGSRRGLLDCQNFVQNVCMCNDIGGEKKNKLFSRSKSKSDIKHRTHCYNDTLQSENMGIAPLWAWARQANLCHFSHSQMNCSRFICFVI